MTPLETAIAVMKACGLTVCADMDEDCELVKDKLACSLYDPEQGHCPYLAAERHYLPHAADDKERA